MVDLDGGFDGGRDVMVDFDGGLNNNLYGGLN